jgi:hypothetical protein
MVVRSSLGVRTPEVQPQILCQDPTGHRAIHPYNGVQVTKNLTRQTLVNEYYAGHFAGALHQDTANVASPAFNGTREQAGVLNVVQSATAVTITTLPSTGWQLCLQRHAHVVRADG